MFISCTYYCTTYLLYTPSPSLYFLSSSKTILALITKKCSDFFHRCNGQFCNKKSETRYNWLNIWDWKKICQKCTTQGTWLWSFWLYVLWCTLETRKDFSTHYDNNNSSSGLTICLCWLSESLIRIHFFQVIWVNLQIQNRIFRKISLFSNCP